MLIEESEFKGKPVLVIKNDENERYPFSFGLSKARKILASYDEIKAFVEKHDVDDEAYPDAAAPVAAPAEAAATEVPASE